MSRDARLSPSRLRAVEIASGSIGASFCGKVLRQLGMQVVKVEQLGRPDPLRDLPPRVPGGDATGLPFRFLNSGKRLVAVDLEHPAGRELTLRLLGRSDVLVQGGTSSADMPFDRAELQRVEPRLVSVGISPLGAPALHGAEVADDFTAFHRSGLGYLTPRAMPGHPTAGLPPLKPHTRLLEMISGLQAVIGVLASLVDRQRTGIGDGIDVAEIQCALPLIRREIAAYLFAGTVATRGERLWKVAPAGIQRCRDGYVFVDIIEDEQWRRLCTLMERGDLLADPRFADRDSRFQHNEELGPILDAWFHPRSRHEVTELGQRLSVPIAPVNSPRDLFEDPQLLARGFFGELVIGAGLRVRAPGIPVSAPSPSAPVEDGSMMPGRDTVSVLCELAEIAEAEVRALGDRRLVGIA